MLKIDAPADEIPDRIRGLTWDEPLPPLLHLHARADELPADFGARVREALDTHPGDTRPEVVENRQFRVTPLPDAEPEEVRPLEELEPADVFARLVRGSGADLDDALLGAFGRILAMTDDDLEAEVRRLEAGAEDDATDRAAEAEA